jgi:protein involved in polysaccharide export with SLBB domain
MNSKSIIGLLLVLLCFALPAFSQIQPGQGIQISVLGVPAEEKGRIDNTYPVGDNGTINLPFIGPVRAAGMKPEALAAALEARYRSAGIYRNPTFQVVANTLGGSIDDQVIHVGGQVRSPGPKKYNRGLTLYQAVQAAGGATEFGHMKRVKLLRGGKQRQYDLTQLQFMQIPLEPNDTIEVPQKRPWDTN